MCPSQPEKGASRHAFAPSSLPLPPCPRSSEVSPPFQAWGYHLCVFSIFSTHTCGRRRRGYGPADGGLRGEAVRTRPCLAVQVAPEAPVCWAVGSVGVELGRRLVLAAFPVAPAVKVGRAELCDGRTCSHGDRRRGKCCCAQKRVLPFLVLCPVWLRVAARQQNCDPRVSPRGDLVFFENMWQRCVACFPGKSGVHELALPTRTSPREDCTDFVPCETAATLVLRIVLESQLSHFKHARC